MGEVQPPTFNAFTIEYVKDHDRLAWCDLGGWQSRTQSTMRLFKMAFERLKRPFSNDFRIVVDTSDRGPEKAAPDRIYFSSAIDASHPASIGCPDFLFDGWHEACIGDYEAARLSILHASCHEPINDRAFWVGNVEMSERRKVLMQIAQANPSLVKAIGITWQHKGPGEKAIPSGGYASFPEHCRYQYLIDVEGEGYSARLKLLLLTGRPVFIQERRWVEYWHRHLVPFETHIPVKNDLSDLTEQLKWARSHSNECRAIARRAQSFARQHLSRSAAISYLVDVLRPIVSRM